jgi:hypothetical protein
MFWLTSKVFAFEVFFWGVIELPPALAGGKGINIKLALAKKDVILAKAIPYYPNFVPPAKAGGNLML